MGSINNPKYLVHYWAYHIACNFPKDGGYESYMDDLSSDPQPRDIGLLWRENMGKSGQPPKSTPRLR